MNLQWWEYSLLFLGVALQLGGVALTIKGARQVWKDVKNPDDRFLAPFIHAAQRIEYFVRKLIGRPKSQTISPDGIPSGARVGRPQIFATYPPLPADLSPGEQIQLLDERLRDTIDQFHRQLAIQEISLLADIDRLTSAQRATLGIVDDRAELERKRAVSGLRVEAYGFFFLTVGTLIQALGSYLGIGN